MLETSGPVPAFTDAVQARDVNRIVGLLSHDVRLSVPPLHFTRRGSQDVIGALVGLMNAFGDLRYDVRSRYVAPGNVTDEAMLVGRQTAPFLGAAPGRGVSTVATRVIIAHDAATITGITVWPDVSALRTAVNGVSRMIDLTKVGDAGGMVAALRATIPPTQAKLIIGSAREQRSVEAGPTSEGAGDAGPLPGRTVPKSPIPRTVRRRRGLVAGTAMIAVSTALTAWVAIGALHSGSSNGAAAVRSDGVQAADDTVTAAAGGAAGGRHAGQAGAGQAAGNSPAGQAAKGQSGTGQAGQSPGSTTANADVTPQHLAPDITRVQLFTTALFFATDRYTLRPEALELLGNYMTDAVTQHRKGVITVVGYTDNVGTPAYNLRLSKLRAQSVAEALGSDAHSPGRFSVQSVGRGITVLFGNNTTEATRRPNRCVVITFPPATGAQTTPGAVPAAD